jgi:sec-independent protein translocase protein TatA
MAVLGLERIGLPELLVVLLIILVLFGARKLPDLARSLGKSLSEFKKGREEGERASAPPVKAGDRPEEQGTGKGPSS